MDRVASFMAEKTPRRAAALGAFVALLYLFRHLAILFVFFVAFQRALDFAASQLAARTKQPKKRMVVASAAGTLLVVALLAAFGVGRTARGFAAMQAGFPDRLAELRENPLVEKIHDELGDTDRIVEQVKHYAGDAIGAASAIGHFFVYVLVAFILAVVFLLEEHEIRDFWERVDPRSLVGTIGRWLRHAADAAVVTVQLQLVVAAFNTVTTLPVLILLGVPHKGGLMLLVFVSALVPVIGNVVSGTVLSLFAYQSKGWLGVGVFVALTFLLHKIESYYLSPRLTARHVKIPGFLLIVSLLACEHLFGFAGLFLSFPILFVTGRIRSEWQEEDATLAGGLRE